MTVAAAVQSSREEQPLVVLDVPLLFEVGLEAAVDAVLVVTAPPAVQRQRALLRPGMTAEKLAGILSRQVRPWRCTVATCGAYRGPYRGA